jgi:heterodisulfide reductase subunit D
MIETMQDNISINRVWYCLDCGKCSTVCPITKWETRAHISPRLLVEKAAGGRMDEILDDYLFWSCLTCKRCSEICPSNVNFSEFVQMTRIIAREEGCSGDCTHSEMIQTWGKMMTDPNLKQNRLGWLNGDLKVSNKSDTIYFVGCLPFYDVAFKHLGIEGIGIAQAAVKILNRMGIEPIVLLDERCCGHDQLWEGDMETFRSLAELNLGVFKSTGAKRIVTTCPECARTLKEDYPKFVGEHSLEILHITELIADEGLPLFQRNDELLSGKAKGDPVTYQDPCRLGRFMGIYDPPRQIIKNLGYELTEMERNRRKSLCCGTSCWTACGQVSKNIQVDRLKEAKATGADLLVTTCVKCQIHFKCAQDDPTLGEEIDIKIRDLTTLVAEKLG